MKRACSLVIFLACLAWIAAGILLHGDAGAGFRHWDTAAAIGAAFGLFGAVDG